MYPHAERSKYGTACNLTYHLNGISPMKMHPLRCPRVANFGEGYRYHITGLFHDRAGFPTQRLDEINPWLARVFSKIALNEESICLYSEEWIGGARDVVMLWCDGALRTPCRQDGTCQTTQRRLADFEHIVAFPGECCIQDLQKCTQDHCGRDEPWADRPGSAACHWSD